MKSFTELLELDFFSLRHMDVEIFKVDETCVGKFVGRVTDYVVFSTYICYFLMWIIIVIPYLIIREFIFDPCVSFVRNIGRNVVGKMRIVFWYFKNRPEKKTKKDKLYHTSCYCSDCLYKESRQYKERWEIPEKKPFYYPIWKTFCLCLVVCLLVMLVMYLVVIPILVFGYIFPDQLYNMFYHGCSFNIKISLYPMFQMQCFH